MENEIHSLGATTNMIPEVDASALDPNAYDRKMNNIVTIGPVAGSDKQYTANVFRVRMLLQNFIFIRWGYVCIIVY